MDNGLYVALNKCLQTATGEVVGILHADDFFADAEVLSQVAEVFEDPDVEACYGNLLYVADATGDSSFVISDLKVEGSDSLFVTGDW